MCGGADEAASQGKGRLQQEIASQGSGGGGRAVESFEYPACPNAPPVPAWDGWAEAAENSSRGAVNQTVQSERVGALPAPTSRSGSPRKRVARSNPAGNAAAKRAAAPNARHWLQPQQRRPSAAAGRRPNSSRNFTRERDRYLHAVEQEVVRLALAVAARILRREAQMDPLLLTGAVRVALGQLAATSEIRLRVPAKEADLWKETIALVPNLTVKPLVVADEGMLLGECVIESKVGTVDLGIRSQLGEIERGFFDRAGAQTRRRARLQRALRRKTSARRGARMTALLERYFSRLECRQPWRWRGHVLESVGQTIESAGPPVSVGECCEIEDHMGRPHRAEVIGFRGSNVLSMPVETTEGIRFGDAVWAAGHEARD